MSNSGLGEFIRVRREMLQPEDVGLSRGPRRRTQGLRREEVADLAGMSSDYYARLERGTAPHPSEQMITAIARALRLTREERDHLFALANYVVPRRQLPSDHINPGLMRILDRLHDTPAQIMGSLGETLLQTSLAVTLLGDQTRYTGWDRSTVYRWFTDSASREIYPSTEHELHGRVFTGQLRQTAAKEGPGSRAADLVDRLLAMSPEFTALWHEQQLGLIYTEQKTLVHPEVGVLSLYCQVLLDPDQQQSLLVYTATPGSESYEKLKLLAVIGSQSMA